MKPTKQNIRLLRDAVNQQMLEDYFDTPAKIKRHLRVVYLNKGMGLVLDWLCGYQGQAIPNMINEYKQKAKTKAKGA